MHFFCAIKTDGYKPYRHDFEKLFKIIYKNKLDELDIYLEFDDNDEILLRRIECPREISNKLIESTKIEMFYNIPLPIAEAVAGSIAYVWLDEYDINALQCYKPVCNDGNYKFKKWEVKLYILQEFERIANCKLNELREYFEYKMKKWYN